MLAESDLTPFVQLALDALHRPYPYHLVHVVTSDADVRPPRELYPAFHGCFDWHSSVHSHWLLVRALRCFPDATWADGARAALARNLTEDNLAREAQYFRSPGHTGFECPYGLAWLLQLIAELRAPRTPPHFEALEAIAVQRIAGWLPRLSYPVRSGEHGQCAFSMGLALDCARGAENGAFASLIVARAHEFFARDTDGPIHYEPSGYDFLSPCLAESDLMRRVLAPDEFADWLGRFLPRIPTDGDAGWLTPARSSDPSDGKLSHLDGLNLSRAWMMQGIAHGLPADDARAPSLRACAEVHQRAGLAAISAEHYAGAHWLGSFAVYLLTGRGIA